MNTTPAVAPLSVEELDKLEALAQAPMRATTATKAEQALADFHDGANPVTILALIAQARAAQQAVVAPSAWLATDLDGRGDVGFTQREAKRRAGEGCIHFFPLFDTTVTPQSQVATYTAGTPRVDALMAKWDDDGATRGSAFIELRDLARELELAAHPAPAAQAVEAQKQCQSCGRAPGERRDECEQCPDAEEAAHADEDHPALVECMDGILTPRGWAKYDDGDPVRLDREACREIFKAGQAAQAQPAAAPALAVWYGAMPESNGRQNYTAILHRKGLEGFDIFEDGMTIDRSEYPDRVRYEADRVRYLIGERAERPEMWGKGYDFDKRSDYVEPVAAAAPAGDAEDARRLDWLESNQATLSRLYNNTGYILSVDGKAVRTDKSARAAIDFAMQKGTA